MKGVTFFCHVHPLILFTLLIPFTPLTPFTYPRPVIDSPANAPVGSVPAGDTFSLTAGPDPQPRRDRSGVPEKQRPGQPCFWSAMRRPPVRPDQSAATDFPLPARDPRIFLPEYFSRSRWSANRAKFRRDRRFRNAVGAQCPV